MVATDTQSYNRPQAGERSRRTNGTNGKATSDSSRNLANGLGWFSIGLGLAEVVTPGAIATLIGVRDDRKTRGVLRGYGVREIAAGIGILSQPRAARWVWGRVAGDVLDLSSLASSLASNGNTKTRLAATTAAIAGITALDVFCAKSLGSEDGQSRQKKASQATKTIAVDRSAEQAYSFWRNFENLPRFMTYLESVRNEGDRLSHWTARGPAGTKIEWDAELVRDEPNRLIAWKSVNSPAFENAGSVRFEPAPGGRGTIVRVEMDFAPSGGILNSALGKVLGADIGSRILHDLRNFKQVLEVGEVIESDASIHSGMHAAQPAAPQTA